MKTKKLVTLFLALALVSAVFAPAALAAGGFDKSVFENSTKCTKSGFSWNLIGGYSVEFAEAVVKVRAMLFDNYVTEGWGPELRVEFYNRLYKDYDEVTAFRASVDDVIYSFEKLDYNGDEDIHGGSAFGGTVFPAFMQDILECRNVSFQIDHIDPFGVKETASIDHVHTGDLSDLQEMAKYLIRSKAFTTNTSPEWNDEYYGASIRK